MNQVLSKTHNIHQSFVDGFENRLFFLNILKSWDKVWHEGPRLKLKRNRSCGSLARILANILNRNSFLGLMLKQENQKVLFQNNYVFDLYEVSPGKLEIKSKFVCCRHLAIFYSSRNKSVFRRSKQEQKNIFTWKVQNQYSSSVIFNNNYAGRFAIQ